MTTAAGLEVVNELFLTAADSSPHALLALGGPDAEEIVLEDERAAHQRNGPDLQTFETEVGDKQDLLPTIPDMWSWNYVGLYCQYAAVGLLYGSSGALIPFCVYTFDGPSNVCSNVKNIVFFAWSFKIFFAVLTDAYRPFGMRRKPWMLLGWALVLLMLLVLACAADQMSVSAWMVSLLFMQCFVVLSDVPADGYSVELGQLEPPEQRGQILATGQRIRFSFGMVAGAIQSFLLNGPSTNDADCQISVDHCWSWGLTVNQYYALLLVIVFALCVPILYLKELDSSRVPPHSWSHYFRGLWGTMQNLTTFYLLVFVIGTHALTNFTNNANITLQYYVIKLTNFQSGIDTITTYAAIVLGVWLFQKYLINVSWRRTQYASTCLSVLLGLVWIAPYHDEGGTMNPWFTIFIDLDTVSAITHYLLPPPAADSLVKQFVQGLAQVLYSMAIIELAVPGQEATTYELIITVGNAALTLNGVIATQLLTPMNAVACDDDYDCPADTVQVTSESSYFDSHGPSRFTNYTLLLSGVSVCAIAAFTQFLPGSKEECRQWKEDGERLGTSQTRAKVSLLLAAVVTLYGLIAAVLLLDVDTACLPEVGGTGCEEQ